jgi:3-phenylpropionate/cinnamic acid dioxygenase small subunit
MSPASETADRAAIERLLYEYAYRLDSGRFEQFADLFRDAVWRDLHGSAAVLEWLRANIVLYDGVPLTHHVVTNIKVDVDGDSARAGSYLTVLQRAPDRNVLTPVTTVCYEDAFARDPNGDWAFRARRPVSRLAGDDSKHRRGSTEAKSALAGVAELSAADRMELRELVDAYAVAADRRDGDAIAGLFSPDGVLQIFDQPDITREPIDIRASRAALAAGPKRLSRFLATSHLVGQQLLEVKSPGVTGTVYCLASHLYRDGDQVMNFVVHVRYLDDYVRSNGTWRFRMRRVVFDFVEHRRAGGPVL